MMVARSRRRPCRLRETPEKQTTGSPVASVVAGYQVLGTSSTQSFGATFPAAMYWASGLVAFKPAP